MLKILYGKEHYTISRLKSEAVSQVEMPDMNYASFQKFDEEVVGLLRTFPFLEDRRVVVIDADSLSVINNEHFLNYIKTPEETSDLIIILRDADQRTKLFKELKAGGYITFCDKLKSEDELKKVLLEELSLVGGKIEPEVLNKFIERENYFDELNDDVTLYGVVNDLIGLCLSSTDKTISLEQVNSLRENRKGKIFSLSKLILSKDVIGLRRELNRLSDEPIAILSLILREYRIAYKANYFDKAEIGTKYVGFSAMSKKELLYGMDVCLGTIRDIKFGKVAAADAMNIAAAKLLRGSL